MLPSKFRPSVVAAAIAVAASLGASAAHAKQPPAPYEYGPPPEWTRFKELGEAAIRSAMFDPEAARIQWPNAFAALSYKPLLDKRVYGYITCGLVNGRNRFGGYVGDAYFLVVIDYDRVVYSKISNAGGYDLLGENCRKANFLPSLDPVPSLTAVQPALSAGSTSLPPPPAPPLAPQPAALDLTLMEVPDGAYVTAVAPGSAAHKAGAVAGMVIARINGISLKGMSASAAAQVLAGIGGTASLEMAGGTAIKVTAP